MRYSTRDTQVYYRIKAVLVTSKFFKSGYDLSSPAYSKEIVFKMKATASKNTLHQCHVPCAILHIKKATNGAQEAIPSETTQTLRSTESS